MIYMKAKWLKSSKLLVTTTNFSEITFNSKYESFYEPLWGYLKDSIYTKRDNYFVNRIPISS